MDLTYPPEAEAFRAEVRAWLEEHLPDGWFEPGFRLSGDARKAFNAEWVTKLHTGGWICASWPREYGGKGLSLIEQVVLNEEFGRADAPMRADFFGDTLVGPTILQWEHRGTEAHVSSRRSSTATIAWCQGFSEPDAGSDLASLKTRADLDGDEWVISGQKVWTTQARFADFIFLLARTDQDVEKHQGISYLLVPMKQPGVEVRPITQIDGSAEFNEVFFSGARCHAPERGGRGQQRLESGHDHARIRAGRVVHHRAPALPARAQPHHRRGPRHGPRPRSRGPRQRLARAWSKVKIMQVNGYRSLTDALHGTHTAAKLGAMNKMFWSEYHRETMELALDILGLSSLVLSGDEEGPRRPAATAAGLHALPRERPAVVVLLQPGRDHLGRHRRDPAQHRGRARARATEGAPADGRGGGLTPHQATPT